MPAKPMIERERSDKNLMNQLRKRFQTEIILAKPHTDKQSSDTAKPQITTFHDEVPTDSATKNTQDLIKSLRDDYRSFKEKKQYEAAAACLQTIQEINLDDDDVLYELAEIYFLQEDYESSYRYLQRFMANNRNDCRGLLLEARFRLSFKQKDDALNYLSQLFQSHNLYSADTNKNKYNEDFYSAVDEFIERLKKIFKLEKLLRRCPNLAEYQKERRRALKNQSAKQAHDEIVSSSKNTNKNNTKKVEKDIMDLTKTIEHIWDMQFADADEKNILLKASADEVNQAIFCQVLSYRKKLWLFNYIAKLFYTNGNIAVALYLLRQALLLDDENDLILKNLGYLLWKNKEYAAAKATLEDISVKDFATLDLINELSK